MTSASDLLQGTRTKGKAGNCFSLGSLASINDAHIYAVQAGPSSLVVKTRRHGANFLAVFGSLQVTKPECPNPL